MIVATVKIKFAIKIFSFVCINFFGESAVKKLLFIMFCLISATLSNAVCNAYALAFKHIMEKSALNVLQ